MVVTTLESVIADLLKQRGAVTQGLQRFSETAGIDIYNRRANYCFRFLLAVNTQVLESNLEKVGGVVVLTRAPVTQRELYLRFR